MTKIRILSKIVEYLTDLCLHMPKFESKNQQQTAIIVHFTQNIETL